MSKSGLADFGDWEGIDPEVLKSFQRVSRALSQSIVPPDLAEKLSASLQVTSSFSPAVQSMATNFAASYAKVLEPLYAQLSGNLGPIIAAQQRWMEELSPGKLGVSFTSLENLRPLFEELIEQHRELLDELEDDEAELVEDAGSTIERRLAQLEELAATGQEGLAQLVEAVVAYRLALLWIVQAKLVALMLVTMAVPGADPLIVRLLGAAAATTQLLDRLLGGFGIDNAGDAGQEEEPRAARSPGLRAANDGADSRPCANARVFHPAAAVTSPWATTGTRRPLMRRQSTSG